MNIYDLSWLHQLEKNESWRMVEVKNELQVYQWRFPRICPTLKSEIQTNIFIMAQKE